MSVDNNRLLLLLEKSLKDTNREVINPNFNELKLDDLVPVIDLVARTRADYLKELFDISAEHPEKLPSAERVDRLKAHRQRYEELLAASQALEAAIEKGYLDVEARESK